MLEAFSNKVGFELVDLPIFLVFGFKNSFAISNLLITIIRNQIPCSVITESLKLLLNCYSPMIFLLQLRFTGIFCLCVSNSFEMYFLFSDPTLASIHHLMSLGLVLISNRICNMINSSWTMI